MTGFGPISAARLQGGRLATYAGDASLAGARNETLGFAVSIDRSALDAGGGVRVASWSSDRGPMPPSAISLGQVMPLPVDFNRAGYIRQNGPPGALAMVPRAVVSLAGTQVPFSALRGDPKDTVLWVDLAIPTSVAAGRYRGAIELTDGRGAVVGRLPIDLTVYDLALPDTRSLNVAGRVTWESLTGQFPDAFEAITPKLINRREPRYAKPVATLDALVKTAQAHRLNLSIERLQPSVKWNPPSTDWTDFDSLVGPWLDGSAFADREPLGFWPLPAIDFLSNYPAVTRREYYAQAAAHFDAREWLNAAPVWLEATDRDAPATRLRSLEQAAGVLESSPRVRVGVPVAQDQVQFADAGGATLPRREDAARLIPAAPGLIFNTPIQTANRPEGGQTFLRTDLTGLVPYAGVGGDERDVRVWTWLAFTRNASILRFDDVLPSATKPDAVADPNELVWFYPGKWFGVDGPVPSLQLKWLRRAEQDHEYLALASTRGERTNAFLMARALTKAVQLQPAQSPDAVYALMTGTADPAAWDNGVRLLARLIALRPPGSRTVEPGARNAVDGAISLWVQPQDKPLMLARSSLFTPSADGKVNLRLGLDLYNPSDTTPRGNTLTFAKVPRNWTINPVPLPVPPLPTFQVTRAAPSADVDPAGLDPRDREGSAVELTDDFFKRSTPATVVVPIGTCRRREGGLALDGSLGDWSDDDAICLAPLTRMIDRPTLQSHAVAAAPTPTGLYTGWGESNVYVAFKVSGLSGASSPLSQNFVRYDFRRAWGEDLVELIVQPEYDDGSLGPVAHIAIKPNGGVWSERKTDLADATDAAWQPLGVDLRFAGSVEKDVWRGELAIPWQALGPVNAVGGPQRRPALLRFNFVQHQQATGISASWAGPIDFGRDDSLTGALVLRDADTGR